ncbi:hypothetical protein ACFLRC_01640 [Candidatus Altiarchaeota archaeon]
MDSGPNLPERDASKIDKLQPAVVQETANTEDYYILQRYSRVFRENRNFRNWSLAFLSLIALVTGTLFTNTVPLTGFFKAPVTAPGAIIETASPIIFAVSLLLIVVILNWSRK